jgi:hopanoid biosynthesis associated RND transporter like protein HpnN
VDFAIHLGMRYMDLLREGLRHEAAIAQAGGDVGPSLVLCSLTTSIGFYVFLPSDYRGIAELGLIAGSGMAIILLGTLTTLPALLTGWLRLGEDQSHRREVRFSGRFLHGLADHGRAIRFSGAAAALVSAVLIYRPGAHFDSNVIRLRDPETESVQAFDALMDATTTSPWYANAVSADLDEAQRVASEMRKLDVVDRAITLADFVPEDQDEKLEILADVAMLLETPPSEPASGQRPSVDEQVAALRDLERFLSQRWVDEARSPLGHSMRVLRGRIRDFLARVDGVSDPRPALESLEAVLLSNLPRQVQRLRDAVGAEEITRDDLPGSLVERMLAPTGQARVQIFPRENLQDNAALERFVEALRGVDPLVSGVSVNLYDFGKATVSSFQQALGLAFVLIALLLLVLWRSLRDVGLALAPLLLGGLVTVAVMAATGIHFNFANVIVLPLLLGVGVDSGIHLVHRAKLKLGRDELLMSTTTARAVFYSALTTVVSFGTLAFSSHRGVASLGVLLTVGMLLTVACNLIFLPALLELQRREP